MNKTFEVYIKSYQLGVPDFEATIEAETLTQAKEKFAKEYDFELRDKDIEEVQD